MRFPRTLPELAHQGGGIERRCAVAFLALEQLEVQAREAEGRGGGTPSTQGSVGFEPGRRAQRISARKVLFGRGAYEREPARGGVARPQLEEREGRGQDARGVVQAGREERRVEHFRAARVATQGQEGGREDRRAAGLALVGLDQGFELGAELGVTELGEAGEMDVVEGARVALPQGVDERESAPIAQRVQEVERRHGGAGEVGREQRRFELLPARGLLLERARQLEELASDLSPVPRGWVGTGHEEHGEQGLEARGRNTPSVTECRSASNLQEGFMAKALPEVSSACP